MISTANVLAQTRTGTYPNISYRVESTGAIARPAGAQGRLFDRNVRSAINDVIGAAGVDIRKGIPRRTTVIERIHGPREHLRDTVRLDLAKTGTAGAVVSTSSPIMVFVENDTKAHIIRPVKAQALRFFVRGKAVFAKEVHHPGTRGKHVWAKADAAVRMRLIRAVDAAITAAFQGVNYVRRYYRT